MAERRSGKTMRQRKARVQRAAEFFQDGMTIYGIAQTAEDFARAADAFSTAIQWTPDNPRLYFARGNCYRAMDVHDKAHKDYGAAIELDDRNAVFFGNRGVCARKLGRPNDAIADYSRAIELDSSNGAFFFNRALALYEVGRHAEAIEDFSCAASDRAHVFRAIYNRGNCHRAVGDLDASLADLSQAVELRPTSPHAHNSLGMTLFAAKEFGRAVEAFSKAIELDEADPRFLNNRGLAHFHGGDFPAATADFDAALALSPRDGELWCNRGNCKLAAGDAVNALSDLKRACALREGDSRALHARALALQETGELEQALAGFDAALRADPGHLASRYHRGLVLARTRRFEEALAALTDVVAAAPGDRLVFLARALVYRDVELHGSALADLDAAIALAPDFAEAYYHRAMALLRLERYERCAKDAARAISLGFAEPCSFSCKAAALRALGQVEAARETLGEALAAIGEGETRAELLFERAQCATDVKDHSAAAEDLRSAISLQADNAKFRHHLGLALLHLGEEAEAGRMLTSALQRLRVAAPQRLRYHAPPASATLRAAPSATEGLLATTPKDAGTNGGADDARPSEGRNDSKFGRRRLDTEPGDSAGQDGVGSSSSVTDDAGGKSESDDESVAGDTAQGAEWDLRGAHPSAVDRAVERQQRREAATSLARGEKEGVSQNRARGRNAARPFRAPISREILERAMEMGVEAAPKPRGWEGDEGSPAMWGGAVRESTAGGKSVPATPLGSGQPNVGPSSETAVSSPTHKGAIDAAAAASLAAGSLEESMAHDREAESRLLRDASETGSIFGSAPMERVASESLIGQRRLPRLITDGAKRLGLNEEALSLPVPFLADTFYYIGVALARLEKHQEAVPAFSAAILLAHSRAWRKLLRAQLKARFGVRQEILEAVGKGGPDIAEGMLSDAANAKATKAAAKLLRSEKSLTEIDSFVATFAHERAKARQLVRDYNGAIADFTVVIRYDPRNAHAHFRRAFAYKATGQFDLAASDFESAKRLDPDNPSLVINYLQIRDTDCIVLCRPGDEPSSSRAKKGGDSTVDEPQPGV